MTLAPPLLYAPKAKTCNDLFTTWRRAVKIVRFDNAGQAGKIGVLTDAGVVDVTAQCSNLDHYSPQRLMEDLIDNFDTLKPEFESAVSSGPVIDMTNVQLRAPLPRPSKILCCIGNYWEHAQREPRNLNMFLKICFVNDDEDDE